MHDTVIPLFVGYDPREAVAYHTFCQSVISRSSKPVACVPLSLTNLKQAYREEHTDGSNQFIYSRFLVPYLMDYRGWALFADGDMVCLDDIARLWALRDERCSVMVVKHEYKTKYPIKYLGARNEDYPRKNWSSVVLWNCGSSWNRVLTPEAVRSSSGRFLHRFDWLPDNQIGALPATWNHLVGEEDEPVGVPSLLHYTVGTPCFNEYADFPMATFWHSEKDAANHADQRT